MGPNDAENQPGEYALKLHTISCGIGNAGHLPFGPNRQRPDELRPFMAQNRPIPAAARSLLTVLYVRYLPDRFSQQRILPFRTTFLERYPR
jgi:hypothetical protein